MCNLLGTVLISKIRSPFFLPPFPPPPPLFPPPTFFFSPKKGEKKTLLVKKSLHFFVFGPLPVSRRTLCWAGGTNLCWYPGPEPRFSLSLNIPKGGRTERTELIGAIAKIIFPPPPAARPFPNYLVACRATRWKMFKLILKNAIFHARHVAIDDCWRCGKKKAGVRFWLC